MGADLLLIRMIHKKGKKLDWNAGRAVIKKMDIEKLKRQLEDADGEVEPGMARRRANEILTAFKREITGDLARDGYEWDIPGGYVMHVRGGTSWGDDPSEGWTIFADAADGLGPEVLKAIGFWYPPKPRVAKAAA